MLTFALFFLMSTKISALADLASVDVNVSDLLTVVDVSEVLDANKNKKLTVGNLRGAINTPGSINSGELEYNNGGVLGGTTGLTWDPVGKALVGFRDKGGQVYNVKAYGAFGDGSSHPLSGVYGTLAAAQVDYPTAVALTDEFDQVALEKALAAIPASGGIVVHPPGIYRWTRNLAVGDGSATNLSTRRNQHVLGAGAGAHDGEITPMTNATRIEWRGAAGGTMLSVKGPVGGVLLEGLMLDCQPGGTGNAANTGLELLHLVNSEVRDVTVVRFAGKGIIINAYPNPTDPTYACAQGCTGNRFDRMNAYIGGAGSTGCLLGDETGSLEGAFSFDPNNNLFLNCRFRTSSTIADSAGMQLSFCDNNTFVQCWFEGEHGIRIAPPSGAVISGGAVASVTVTHPGFQYTSVPTVSFKGGGGSGATGTASMGMQILSYASGGGGTGYTNGTNYALGIAGGGGAGATGLFDVVGGAVTNVRAVLAGSGYTSQPTISFPGAGAGTGAATTAYLKLVGVTVTDGGTGYKYKPSVVIGAASPGFSAYAGLNAYPQSCLFLNCPTQGGSYVEEDGWTGTPEVANLFVPWQTGDLEPVPSPEAKSFTALTFGGNTLGDWRASNTYHNAPQDLVATPSTASGVIPAGTYYFMVVAYDGQGFSLPSVDVKTVLSATGKVALTWKSVLGATSYTVYKGTGAGRAGKQKYVASTDTYYEWSTDVGAGTVTTAEYPPITPGTANYRFSRDGNSWLNGKMGFNKSNPSCGVEILGGGFQATKVLETVAPVVTPQGTAGATTYAYYVVSEDVAGRRSIASAVGQTTTGNATLSATNFNRIETVPVPGARKYYILKKATAPTAGATESILLKTVVVGTDATYVFDRGAALDPLTSFTNASRNTTADATFQGRVVAESVISLARGAAVGQTLTANATTYIAGSDHVLPDSGLAINHVFEWEMDVSKTAAGTAAKSFAIKVGTTSTVSDATVLTLALPAGTAVVDQGTVRVRFVVKAIGASANGYGSCLCSHGLPITGLMTSHAAAPAGLSSNFASNVAGLRVGLAFVAGASEVWTIQNIVTRGP